MYYFPNNFPFRKVDTQKSASFNWDITIIIKSKFSLKNFLSNFDICYMLIFISNSQYVLKI